MPSNPTGGRDDQAVQGVHPARQPRGPGGRGRDRYRVRRRRLGVVRDLVTPLIAAIGGKPDFSQLTVTLNDSKFLYGDFINALLAFLIVAAVVFFFVIKPVNLLMTRRKVEPATGVATRGCPECLSEIPVPARRCAFCTAEVPPAA